MYVGTVHHEVFFSKKNYVSYCIRLHISAFVDLRSLNFTGHLEIPQVANVLCQNLELWMWRHLLLFGKLFQLPL